MIGGNGNDLLVGGAGRDRFFLSPNFGNDIIIDFETGINSLVLFSSLSYAQLNITQSNNDTLLSVNSTGQVLATLTRMQANLISATDFIAL